MQAQYNNNNQQIGGADPLNEVDYESGENDAQTPYSQKNQGSQEGLYDENGQAIQNDMD